MSSNGEIIIVTFPFSGHIFPATELATILASRNYQITLVLPSIPSSPLHPLIRTVQCSSPPPGPPRGHSHSSPPPLGPPLGHSLSPPPPPGLPPSHSQSYPPPPGPPPGHFQPSPPPGSKPNQGPSNESGTEHLLARLIDERDSSSPPLLCVIVDMMIADQLIKVCIARGVPAASLYTASACVAALEHAASSVKPEDVGPYGSIVVPGLPEVMALTAFNLSQGGPAAMPPSIPPLEHHSPPPFGQGKNGGPPPPPAMGLGQIDNAVALIFNTCDNLEHPFLEYIGKQAKKPVLAVGPLLPAQFWSAVTGSACLVHDESIRSKHNSSHTEQEVLTWLDSKPLSSVIYISFGSGNTPCDAELAELAAGLEGSNRAFIWVIQKSAMKHDPAGLPIHEDEPSSFDSNELAERFGDRGLVIQGWAPQLMILSHKSTGGFLTHCGWNSTVEALGCGMPMLTWPIHGDQIYNAKLVTKQLGVAHVLKLEGQGVKRDQVVLGIEKLMEDEEMRARVKAVSKEVFGQGFPRSSVKAIDEFLDLIDAKHAREC